MERLKDLGIGKEATQYTPEDRILATYTAPHDMYGARLEFIESSRKEGMEAWIAGKSWQD